MWQSSRVRWWRGSRWVTSACWPMLTSLTSSTINGYKIHLYRRHQKCRGIS
jgi:hypothetical protein